MPWIYTQHFLDYVNSVTLPGVLQPMCLPLNYTQVSESSTASMAGHKTKGLAQNYSHQMVSCSSAPNESSFSCPYRPSKVGLFPLRFWMNCFSAQKVEWCLNGGRIWDCIMIWAQRQVTLWEQKPWRETALKQIYTIAPSLANDAHCSHTNKIKQCCITVGYVRRTVCLNVVIQVKFVGNVPYMFNSIMAFKMHASSGEVEL